MELSFLVSSPSSGIALHLRFKQQTVMKQRKRLEKLIYGDHNFGRLIKVSAFWKNDKPSGFGLSYDIDDEDICAILADMFEAYIGRYKEADAADRLQQISEYREQLDNYRELLSSFPAFEICLIGNVWFLEYMGLIDADNFNGMMMKWGK